MTQNQQQNPEVGELSALPALLTRETDPMVAQKLREAAGLEMDAWPDERLRAVSQTVCPKGTTLYQMGMFLSVAKQYQLDPFVGEIWLAKDGDKMMILTGRDSFLAIAERDPNYEGFDHGVVYANDTFEVEKDGDEIKIRHLITGFERGARVGAYCLAHRDGRKPVLIIRRWDHYKSLHNRPTWRNNPDDMLSTRVITMAHRLLYRISGIYTAEEFEGRVSEDGKQILSVEEAGQAAGQTQARIDSLRKEHEARQKALNEDADQPPDQETIAEDQEPEDIGSETIQFGKWKDRTWQEVLETEANAVGYIRNWVLGGECDHESLTSGVRSALTRLVNQHEEKLSAQAPDPLESPEEEATEAGEEEDSASSSEDLPDAETLLTEAKSVVTLLAKAGKLETAEAEEYELLLEEGDLDGLKRLVDKLTAKLTGEDPNQQNLGVE